MKNNEQMNLEVRLGDGAVSEPERAGRTSAPQQCSDLWRQSRVLPSTIRVVCSHQVINHGYG